MELKKGSITDVSVVGITTHRVVLKVGYLDRRFPNALLRRKEFTHIMDNPSHATTVNGWFESIGGSDHVLEIVRQLNVEGR